MSEIQFPTDLSDSEADCVGVQIGQQTDAAPPVIDHQAVDSVAQCAAKAKPEVVAIGSGVLCRTVARALSRLLEQANTTIHWVNVVGESSLQPKATKLWPSNNSMFTLMLTEGNSEGMYIYVMAQECRYRPDRVEPILQIKMLGSYKQVVRDMALVWEFFQNFDESQFVT